jgi:hypothetical protein
MSEGRSFFVASFAKVNAAGSEFTAGPIADFGDRPAASHLSTIQ